MDLLGTLQRSGGIQALGRQAGTEPAATLAVAKVLLPAIVERMRALIAHDGGGEAGLAGLVALFDRFGDGMLAADVMAMTPVPPDAGAALAEALFGAEGGDGAVRAAAAATGVEPAIVARVLGLLAMLAGGYLSARAHSDGIARLAGALETLFGPGEERI